MSGVSYNKRLTEWMKRSSKIYVVGKRSFKWIENMKKDLKRWGFENIKLEVVNEEVRFIKER